MLYFVIDKRIDDVLGELAFNKHNLEGVERNMTSNFKQLKKELNGNINMTKVETTGNFHKHLDGDEFFGSIARNDIVLDRFKMVIYRELNEKVLEIMNPVVIETVEMNKKEIMKLHKESFSQVPKQISEQLKPEITHLQQELTQIKNKMKENSLKSQKTTSRKSKPTVSGDYGMDQKDNTKPNNTERINEQEEFSMKKS